MDYTKQLINWVRNQKLYILMTKLHLVLLTFKHILKIGINHITTRTHPVYCERYIRTFKSLLAKRLDDIDKPWTDLIDMINNIWINKMMSSAANSTPKKYEIRHLILEIE